MYIIIYIIIYYYIYIYITIICVCECSACVCMCETRVGGCVRVRLCCIESSRGLLMPEIPRGVRAGVLADCCNDWESWQDLALGRLKGTANFTHERV